MRNALHSPLSSVEPIRTEQAWAAPLLGYAERKAGVDTMRAETTFLWMSDLFKRSFSILQTSSLTSNSFTDLNS